jgi:hypothetical protein
MKSRTVLIAFTAMLMMCAAVSAHERKVGLLIDTTCGKRLADSPEEAAAHTVSCSLKEECAKTGYGVIVDGRFFKFDKMGNKLATLILKTTKKKAGVRVKVDGHFDSYIISPTVLEPID